jgi:ATP-binding protein involved in chromosome partitioning
MSKIALEKLLDALKKVKDPDLGRDIVSLNMIKNISLTQNSLKFDLELTTPACPMKDKMKADCEDIIKKTFPELKEIKINLTSNVTRSSRLNLNTLLPEVKNTIAVASGKGGVGKSSIAVNLAAALSKQGSKVGLIDADIYGPSIPLMLGVDSKPKLAQNEFTGKITPVEKYGIKLMSIGFFIDDNNPVIWRGPMASGAIKQFLTDIEWGELDYLIFDIPPGTGDIQLTLLQTIPLTGAVIVTTPQEVALIDARKGLRMFERLNTPVLGIVENMSYFIAPDTNKEYDIFGRGGGEKLAKENNVSFLGSLPIDPRIRIGGDTGKPIVYDLAGTIYEKIIINISQQLAAQISIVNSRKESTKLEIEL